MPRMHTRGKPFTQNAKPGNAGLSTDIGISDGKDGVGILRGPLVNRMY